MTAGRVLDERSPSRGASLSSLRRKSTAGLRPSPSSRRRYGAMDTATDGEKGAEGARDPAASRVPAEEMKDGGPGTWRWSRRISGRPPSLPTPLSYASYRRTRAALPRRKRTGSRD